MEEEQTLEELQSLRDIVQDWFRKQEEIAEVSFDHASPQSMTHLPRTSPPSPVTSFFSFYRLSFVFQNAREPNDDVQLGSPTASVPKSGSSGMIQYLQSWFPGWGGWYGEAQDPDRPEELLASPSSWDILGE